MGTDLDPTSPANNDIVADYPPDERAERLAVQTLIATEHYEGLANNDRHKIALAADRAAVDAAITEDLSGNFAFVTGAAPGADAPRLLGVDINDGTEWHRVRGVLTGMIMQTAFDVATPPEGYLACDGAAVSRTTYADLFAVLSTAFDNQNGAVSPAGTDFRVPLIGGHTIVGLTATKRGQPGWVRRVTGGIASPGITGTYTDTDIRIYIIEIVTSSTPDTFRYSDDGGATWQADQDVAASETLNNGLTVVFPDATTGYSAGDIWTFVAHPDLDTVGKTVGTNAWQLVEAEIPDHTHVQDTHRHDVVSSAFQGAALSGSNQLSTNSSLGGNDQYDLRGTSSAANRGRSESVVATNQATGGDEAHGTTPHALVLGHLIAT